VLDTADIVREAIFHQSTPLPRYDSGHVHRWQSSTRAPHQEIGALSGIRVSVAVVQGAFTELEPWSLWRLLDAIRRGPEEWNDEVHTDGWVTLWPVTTTAEGESELVAKWRAAGQVLVPSPKRSAFQLDWLCPKCFEACREDLGFVVDPQHAQWQKAGI